MSTKADYTAAEWSQLRSAPLMAGLVVTAASPSGPIGVIREVFAVGKVLAGVKSHGDANELVKALVADLTAGGSAPTPPGELRGKSPEQVRSLALEQCRQAATAVGRKAKPKEAEGFRRWLLAIAQRVAEAAKEGGFLGFGGTAVSEQETAALKDLSAALGVKA